MLVEKFLKRGKKGEREGERLAFALCSIKNYTRMPNGKYAVNSSVLGSRAEQQLWQHGRSDRGKKARAMASEGEPSWARGAGREAR